VDIFSFAIIAISFRSVGGIVIDSVPSELSFVGTSESAFKITFVF